MDHWDLQHFASIIKNDLKHASYSPFNIPNIVNHPFNHPFNDQDSISRLYKSVLKKPLIYTSSHHYQYKIKKLRIIEKLTDNTKEFYLNHNSEQLKYVQTFIENKVWKMFKQFNYWQKNDSLDIQVLHYNGTIRLIKAKQNKHNFLSERVKYYYKFVVTLVSKT